MILMAKKISCNSYWLRFFIHVFFGVLIVTSFILILLMTVGDAFREARQVSPRCISTSCTVLCTEAPYFNRYEEDIANAALEAARECKGISLVLIKPSFKNSTIPEHWLTKIRVNVHELSIKQGNLKQIAPSAFMNPFAYNIKSLVFENVTLSNWKDDTFVGLANLKQLFLKDCLLVGIKKNALQAVDDTLEYLNIKSVISWDPTNVTGSAEPIKLEYIDFSHNPFYSILNNASFFTINHTKVLYLNSCKITYLGNGTFDNLYKLQELYLNNNFLVTIPTGLFDVISTHPIRVALHDNFWYCDCSQNDLRYLFQQGMLLINIICSYPDEVHRLTSAEFEDYCNNKEESKHTSSSNQNNTPTRDVVHVMKTCQTKNVAKTLFYPKKYVKSKYNVCSSNRVNNSVFEEFGDVLDAHSKNYDWITPLYSMQLNHYTMVEISLSELHGVGLLWYPTLCKNEAYCINMIPKTLKLYNISIDMDYTFCPFNIFLGTVESNRCVTFNFANFEKEHVTGRTTHNLIFISFVSLLCLVFGAGTVYAIIQRHPTLLKGNKRVVLVKHKTIDALILPPNLPLRNNGLKDTGTQKLQQDKLFVLTQSNNNLSPQIFKRSVSMKSSNSNNPSYVSALQPTEKQLFEWRCSQNANQMKITPLPSDNGSSSSSLYESMPYYSLQIADKIYETVK